ncbi:MAG: MBL fold metallo-hydrolase [Candidatus Hodarchaeota archaeon]
MSRDDRSINRVTDQILVVKGENNGKFPYSNSILILDEKTVLIDTGCGPGALKQLKEKYDISYVINSHTHPDHSAGNWMFKDKCIHVPEQGFDTSGDKILLSERFVSKELAPLWRKMATESMGFKDCKPTNKFNDKTIFDFGRTIFKPIYTPGHTKDHYCFYEERERVLLSFDYDLTRFPWYGHRESSLPQFKESIIKIKALSPRVVITSHREVVNQDIDYEFDQFCKRIDERDEKILSLLNSKKEIEELVESAPIYGRFPYFEPLLRYFEEQMIMKHLEQLEIEGRIKRNGNHYELTS